MILFSRFDSIIHQNEANKHTKGLLLTSTYGIFFLFFGFFLHFSTLYVQFIEQYLIVVLVISVISIIDSDWNQLGVDFKFKKKTKFIKNDEWKNWNFFCLWKLTLLDLFFVFFLQKNCYFLNILINSFFRFIRLMLTSFFSLLFLFWSVLLFVLIIRFTFFVFCFVLLLFNHIISVCVRIDSMKSNSSEPNIIMFFLWVFFFQKNDPKLIFFSSKFNTYTNKSWLNWYCRLIDFRCCCCCCRWKWRRKKPKKFLKF